MGRTVAQRGRRVAAAIVVAAGAGLFTGAGAWAATPSAGLYEGHLANGITVALTVTDGSSGPVVTRTGAICQAVDDDFVHNSGAVISGADATGDYSYDVGSNGAFGQVTYGDDDKISGRLDGDSGTVSISRNSYVVRGCDIPQDADNVHNSQAYPIPVARIGAARGNVTDGQWARQEPGGQPGIFYVWAGGAFVGRFPGDPYIGQESEPQCQVTPATLNEGARLGADGSFSLPWDTGSLPEFDPVTPTTGALAGGAGTWTYVLDAPYIADTQLSQCDPPQPTTVAVSLTKAQPVHKPFPAPKGSSSSSPVPGGTTAPSQKCPSGAYKTTAGAFVLCTTVKPKISGSTATLTGRVTINGFLFAKVDELTVGLRSGRLHANGDVDFGAILAGEDLTLGRTPLDLQSGKLAHVSLPGLRSRLRLGGLKVDLSKVGGTPPSVSIDLAAGSISVSAGVSYTLASSTLALDGTLGVSRKGITAELHSKGFSVPLRIAGRQLFELKSLDFTYSQPDDAWSLGGAADVALPGGFSADASASGGVKHGRFDALKLALEVKGGAGIPGPFGTFVSGGSFDLSGASDGFSKATIGLGLDGGWPFEVKRAVGIGFKGTGSFDIGKLRLTLGADATVTATDVQLAQGKATLTIDFDDPLFELDQNVNVLDLIHGDALLRIDGQHFVSQSKLDVEFGHDSPPIAFIRDHWPFGFFHDPPDHIGPLLTADAIVSDIGAGARTEVGVWKLKFGATVIKRWGHALDYDVGFGETKPISGLTPSTAMVAARSRGVVVRVARGRQALVVSGSGSASGQLVLRDPRGRVVVDSARLSAPVAQLQHGRVLFSRRATLGLAGVIVRSPRPGRWRVASGGARPFSAVRETAIGPASGDLGRVLSTRPGRTVRAGQLLRVRVGVPAGATVQLRGTPAGRGDDAGVPLGIARRGIVHVRVPATYTGRYLRLVAVTRRGGVSVGVTRARERLRVIRHRLGRARHLRVARGSRTTVVRFDRVPGASRYIVTLVVRGRHYQTTTRRGRATLRVPTRRTAVSVRVAAVSAADARVGPTASTTVGRR